MRCVGRFTLMISFILLDRAGLVTFHTHAHTNTHTQLTVSLALNTAHASLWTVLDLRKGPLLAFGKIKG